MFLTMRSLAEALAAFHKDLFSDGHQNVIAVANSKFGRNGFENGSAGTDRGQGGVMFLLGGAIASGRVLADWPGLAPEQLYEGQDLGVTIDYRDVLPETLTRRLGNPDYRNISPDPAYTPVERGVLRG